MCCAAKAQGHQWMKYLLLLLYLDFSRAMHQHYHNDVEIVETGVAVEVDAHRRLLESPTVIPPKQ